jgi:hypothetical protein
MLNVFKMRSNVARMELFGEGNLEKGKAQFVAAYEKLKAKGGGTISIYYHPCEWVHREFWDGVNFSRGANPARKDWKLPKARTSEETEKAFRDFEAYVKFIKAQSGVRYVTANELKEIYADGATARAISLQEVKQIANAVQSDITFLRMKEFTLSPADAFSVMNEAVFTLFHDHSGNLPRVKKLQGPIQQAKARGEQVAIQPIASAAIRSSVLDVYLQMQKTRRIPNEIKIDTVYLSPADYLATLGDVFLQMIAPGKKKLPTQFTIRKGNFTADKYVANDDPKIFNWVIHPEGFHAPKLMELAKLQAWTLKPAIMKK